MLEDGWQPDEVLYARILVTLAYHHSELGHVDLAARLLDEAAARGPTVLPAVRVARGALMVRTGRPDEAIADLDQAVVALTAAKTTDDQEDLAGALINRGLMHISAGRLVEAAADSQAAGQVARQMGRPDIRSIADHNFGYVRFLSGDLPGSLAAMEAAAAGWPQAVDGVSLLDRAKVLAAAGLVEEAREGIDEAVRALRANRATADLIEAYGVLAGLDLMAGEPGLALRHARQAAALATKRGNVQAALVAQVLQLRASAASRHAAVSGSRLPASAPGRLSAASDFWPAGSAPGRLSGAGALPAGSAPGRLLGAGALPAGSATGRLSGAGALPAGSATGRLLSAGARRCPATPDGDPTVHRTRQVRDPAVARRMMAARDAAKAEVLIDRLGAERMAEEVRSAMLLRAEALIDAGDPAGARVVSEAVHTLPGLAPLSARLHTYLVDGRLELEFGHRKAGLAHVRRGLDVLATFQANFGSQELQSSASIHGRELARAGLRTAMEHGSPAQIFEWLERALGVTTRLPTVRPTRDAELAADLTSLRAAFEQARAADLAGRHDPALECRVRELRHKARSRAWISPGRGRVERPLTLGQVRRRLGDAGQGASVVAYMRGAGQLYALSITARDAQVTHLCAVRDLQSATRRAGADLNALAVPRIPDSVRAVARESLRDTLRLLSSFLLAPILSRLGDGPLMITGMGDLATVPWSLLAGLAGRPVSVNSSVTAAMARRPEIPAHLRGVLAVSGPEVPVGAAEAREVAAIHPGAALLTGSSATGAAVLSGVPDRGLLHIAAHGQHESESPLFSSVLLADGPLYGYDLAPNPSMPAQVVLSSCDVGRNDVRGGEPLGLAAALLRSGVNTVIAGVCKVSDEVAAQAMCSYHRRLAKGDGPAVALAAAVGSADGEFVPFTCFGLGDDGPTVR